MASFLTTSGTSFQIEKIMIDAKKELVLISPYLKFSKTFFERLQDACKKGVLVKIIFGKNELQPTEDKQIKSLENIELYFSQNLHAKCYYNESSMVITSMNMYEFSEKNNREMGVHITHQTDKKVFDEAVSEAKSILNNSIFKFKSEKLVVVANKEVIDKSNGSEGAFTFKKKLLDNSTSNAWSKAVCIRCGNGISLNPFQPMCDKCYKSWSKFGNEDYIENFCHKCKKPLDSSLAKPLCYDCFKELPQDVRKKLTPSF